MSSVRTRPAAPQGWSVAALKADLTVLARLAGPVVVSRLGIMGMGLTDAVIVGRYSPLQLSFHALAWAPTAVVINVVVALLAGIPVMTSRALGAARRDLAGAVLRRGLVYASWIGGGATIVLVAFGPVFLRVIGLGSPLAAGAGAVLVLFSLSLIPYALSTAMGMWLEALSRPAPAMAMMWLANGVNLAIDLILVPGRFGVPALGAMGGACATLGARLALLLASTLYILLMSDARELGVFDKPAPDPVAAAEQRRVGIGAGASGFFEFAAFSGMTIIAGWIGGLAIAAYTIAITVVSTIFMAPLGLSSAAAVMVGGAYGARDRTAVNRRGVVAFAVAATFGATAALFIFACAPAIAAAYTHVRDVAEMARGALLLCCLFLIPDALQVVASQTLRARGDVWVPAVTHFISYGLVMAPLAWALALPMHMGVNGMIVATIVASLLSASLLLSRFWILAKRPTI